MDEDNSYEFDVFISYSHSDSAWVEKTLYPKLQGNDLKVIYDKDFPLGSTIIKEIDKAISNSRHILFIISQSWLDSDWTRYEYLITQGLDLTANKRKIIPLYIRDVQEDKIPISLKGIKYGDFRKGCDFDFQIGLLMKSLCSRTIQPEKKGEVTDNEVVKLNSQSKNHKGSNTLVPSKNQQFVVLWKFPNIPAEITTHTSTSITNVIERHLLKLGQAHEICKRPEYQMNCLFIETEANISDCIRAACLILKDIFKKEKKCHVAFAYLDRASKVADGTNALDMSGMKYAKELLSLRQKQAQWGFPYAAFLVNKNIFDQGSTKTIKSFHTKIKPFYIQRINDSSSSYDREVLFRTPEQWLHKTKITGNPSAAYYATLVGDFSGMTAAIEAETNINITETSDVDILEFVDVLFNKYPSADRSIFSGLRVGKDCKFEMSYDGAKGFKFSCFPYLCVSLKPRMSQKEKVFLEDAALETFFYIPNIQNNGTRFEVCYENNESKKVTVYPDNSTIPWSECSFIRFNFTKS